ncbi:hypothetical protein B0H11DRAFT_328788 [Mycena galericulata]|nr:hypothetical protein B0H11DRAFT_328788 [Mycena galericulata]
MSRSPFLPPGKELYLEGHSMTTRGDDSPDALLDSAKSLLEMSRKAPNEPRLKSSRFLRLISVCLHSTLLAIHLVLVVVWSKGIQHRLTFPLEHQSIVSFFITAITTAFGTIYSALLVFVTQTLSMRRDLQIDQALTTTHDTAAAWASVGSAISTLWHQKAVPASFLGVLSAFVYLVSILILHITTSSLFSLQTFNATRSIPIGTHGLPALDSSRYNLSDPESLATAWDDAVNYAIDNLYFLPSVVGSTGTLGLYRGTLYDVLESSNIGTGNTTVNATGFNITCNYLTGDITLERQSLSNWWSLQGEIVADSHFTIYPTQPGVISSATTPTALLINGTGSVYRLNTSLLYSTIPILDSSGYDGVWVNATPSISSSVSSIFPFQCFQSLVSQTAVVDVQSGRLITVQPDIVKTTSTWSPPGSGDTNDPENALVHPGTSYIDAWVDFYTLLPESKVPRDYNDTTRLSIADAYLIQRLQLLPANLNRPKSVMLHDVENALSEVVAAIFWTLGHIAPSQTAGGFAFLINALGNNTTTISFPMGPTPPGPILLQGNAIVQTAFPQARLNLSIIAVTAGLVISVVLLVVSLQFWKVHDNKDEVVIDGTGILHAMWLYQNHPELKAPLEEVEHPTNNNLREAGMVRVRLVDGYPRKRRGSI